MTEFRLRFRDFELDPAQFALCRAGHRVRLERKPLELLILLVEKRGELVAREEIIQRVWGKDVFFDAERGINNAIRKIRSALNDESGQPRFVETVVGKGYRFIAPVNGASLVAQSSSAESTREPTTVLRWPRALPGKLWLAATGLLVAVLSILLILNLDRVRQRSFASSSTARIQSLAVLPLENLSGDPAQEYFADGMTEAVIGRLSMIHGLRVISRTSVMRFKDTRMSVPEIAKMLNVDAIVEGSVVREGGRVRVHAQLIRGATDEHFWSETYDRELRDALALQSEVAQSIARKVEVSVTGEESARLVAARPVSPEVYENYLKGRFAKNNSRVEVERSIAYFEEAIRKDPTFAPAYVGLAEGYGTLSLIFVGGAPPREVRPKMIRAARKALELDPELAEAHVLLADTYQKQWQWSDAEAEYRRALELKPNDPTAHAGLASWLLCQGRTEEALAWSRRARELDPVGAGGSIGWILFHARRYDEALAELRSAAAVHPDDPTAPWFLGFVLIAKGQPEEAIPELQKTASIMNRSPGSLELLATAHAHAGRRTEALRLIDELKRRRETTYVPAGAFINPYLALGDYDEAFVWFERAYQEQSPILQFLKVHPFFDPVRGDPRFKDLLRRVGLN